MPTGGSESMRGNKFAGLLVLLLAVFSRAACAEDSQPACQPHPKLGEELRFQGRWIGLHVGSGIITVKELATIQNREAVHLVAEGRTNEVLSKFYPIQDEIHSYVDRKTLQPLQFEKKQREGRYRSDERVIFNPEKGEAEYESLLNGEKKPVRFTPPIYDLLAAIYWFRNQPLDPNTEKMADLYTDEKIYNTKIVVGDLVDLELRGRGTFQSFMVEPKAVFKGILVKRGRLWGYLTPDRRRLPLMIKATTPWGPMSAVLDEESIQKAREEDYAAGCAAGP